MVYSITEKNIHKKTKAVVEHAFGKKWIKAHFSFNTHLSTAYIFEPQTGILDLSRSIAVIMVILQVNVCVVCHLHVCLCFHVCWRVCMRVWSCVCVHACMEAQSWLKVSSSIVLHFVSGRVSHLDLTLTDSSSGANQLAPRIPVSDSWVLGLWVASVNAGLLGKF